MRIPNVQFKSILNTIDRRHNTNRSFTVVVGIVRFLFHFLRRRRPKNSDRPLGSDLNGGTASVISAGAISVRSPRGDIIKTVGQNPVFKKQQINKSGSSSVFFFFLLLFPAPPFPPTDAPAADPAAPLRAPRAPLVPTRLGRLFNKKSS